MNRYPVWKYAIIVIALLVGIIYTLPNFYGEAPAVQVASVKATVTVDRALEQRVETLLADAGVKPLALTLEAGRSSWTRMKWLVTMPKSSPSLLTPTMPGISCGRASNRA